MTIDELYEKLQDPDFQDTATGQLFFPAYMYLYDVAHEAEIERRLQGIKEGLHRPSHYLDALILDIFEELVEFLKGQSLAGMTKWAYYTSVEKEQSETVAKSMGQDAYSKKFLEHLDARIQQHIDAAGDNAVAYVFMKGFGRAHPYLRVSRFMNHFEGYIKDRFKLILFYPGTYNRNYQLFEVLEDEHLYRAIKLINPENA